MPLITVEGKNHLICFDEKVVTVEDTTMYEYEAVRVPFPYEKGHLVSAIVREHYSPEAMEAIMNNKLQGGSEEHELEFQIMQDWRAKAKAIAGEVVSKTV